MLSVLLFPEGFARILDIITPLQKCWLIWKNHVRGPASSSSFSMLLPFSKKSCWELMTTFKPEDHLVGVFTKSGSFSPTHISGHPHISHQIQHSSPISKSLQWALGIRRKWSNVCMLKSPAAFGRTGRVWSWKGSDLTMKQRSHKFITVLQTER